MRRFFAKRVACSSAALALLVAACTSTWWRASFFMPSAVEPPGKAPFLKCHGPAGELWVLERWTVSGERRLITGHGRLYDADRHRVAEGDFEVPFEQIALAETNQPETVVRSGLAVLGVLAGASLGVTAYCAANTKACFGSCPTFYSESPGGEVLEAEGFSASIARSLEATDVDAIDPARPLGRRLQLIMRNEALETHFVARVRLLVAPRPPGGRVFHAGSRFVAARSITPPASCRGMAGDCTALVASADSREYRSFTDGKDLASEEIIELTFPRAEGASGLVVRARNTLLNTFVFYQALAWLGAGTGEWLARIDRPGAPPPDLPALGGPLARIRVVALTRHGWREAGAFEEVGPLAWETQLVPLPADLAAEPVRIRLVATRGNWRIDQLGLAAVTGEVAPVEIAPAEVWREGSPDPRARALLAGAAAGDHLVTYPGDEYRLVFEVPEVGGEPELFLLSRGYYYEWIREQWLAEEDRSSVAALVVDPASALRRLAPAYQRVEKDLDAVFWSSRVRGLR